MNETSAGAIIFRDEGNSRKYLLLNYPSGHWDFVKGKVEKEESLHQTAIREAKEETGIVDLKFIDSFKEEIRYNFQYKGETIYKKVVFYLAQTSTSKVTLSDEHTNFLWLGFDEAMQKTTYDNAKDILAKAEKLCAI